MGSLLGLAGICVGVYLLFVAMDKAAEIKLRELEDEQSECCGKQCKCDVDGDICHCHDEIHHSCEGSCGCYHHDDEE